MPEETNVAAEQWMADVINQQSAPGQTEEEYQRNLAWSEYSDAQKKMAEAQAADAARPAPVRSPVPMSDVPGSLASEGAEFELAKAKMGLAGMDDPTRPWEAQAEPGQKQPDTPVVGQPSADPLADLLDERQRIMAMADEARAKGLKYIGDDVARARQAGEEVVAERELLQTMQGQGIEAAQQRAEELQAAFDQAAIDMESVRVNPQRWEQATPALAQVFMAIASSAFAFFSGGRGVNPVVALIDRAIQRDVQAQMANADTKMSAIEKKLGGAQVRTKLQSTLEAAMYERAVQGLNFMVQNSRDESARAMSAAAYQEALSKAHDVHVDRIDQYVKLASTPVPQGKQLKPDFIAKQTQDMGTIMEGTRLVGDIAQLVRQDKGLNPITRTALYSQAADLLGFDTEAGNLDAQIESFATRIARATKVDVGNFAQQEARRFIDAVRGKQWDKAQTAIKNIGRKMGDFYQTKSTQIEALKRAGYDISPFDPYMESVNKAMGGMVENVKSAK